jgi:hypothetical protein
MAAVRASSRGCAERATAPLSIGSATGKRIPAPLINSSSIWACAIPCPKCGKIQSRNGKHQIVLRTLFGKLRLDSPRFLPLWMLQQGGVPQLQSARRLTDGANDARVGLPGNKFAALISYGLTAELLAEVLPTGGNINVAGVYRNLQGVAERMEAELGEEKWNFIEGCQGDWDRLPPPGPPLTVELDSGFTPRSRNPMARAGSKSSRARACQRKALRTALLTCRPRTQSRSDGCSN